MTTPHYEPSTIIPVISVDFGGHTPESGDHIAIPAKFWSEMCWLAGAASITMKDSPIAQRAHEAVSRPWPIVRFTSPHSDHRSES